MRFRNRPKNLTPLTHKFFEEMAGILKTKGKLSRTLLKERSKEKELENKKRDYQLSQLGGRICQIQK